MAPKLPRIPEAWKNDRANAIESVTVEGSPPTSDGAKWEVRAYFIDPAGMGWTAKPKDAVHGGIKIYRNGTFVYSIDAGPQKDRMLKDGTLGKLVFQRSPDSMSVNKTSFLADDIDDDDGEVILTPPHGVSPQNFAQALTMAAKSYDDSLPYSLPPFATFDFGTSDISNPMAGTLLKMPYGVQNHLAPKTYNSNSFLAGLLTNVGAGENIEAIKKYVERRGYVAPGIDNSVPRDRFRDR
jgi:hypothetical protein